MEDEFPQPPEGEMMHDDHDEDYVDPSGQQEEEDDDLPQVVDDEGVSMVVLPEDDQAVLAREGINPVLEKDVVAVSLSDLGHNPEGRIVYRRATLPSLGLQDVGVLQCFGNIQALILDHNQISDTTPLASLRCLVSVQLAHNAVDDTVWANLASSALSLNYVDVSCNEVTSLDGVEALRFLVDLIVSENQITSASPSLKALKSLRRLDISKNKISKLENVGGHPLRVLDASHCELCDIDGLGVLAETLEELHVSDNNIMKIAELNRLPRLRVADLASNNIYDLDEVNNLTSLTYLRTLLLMGNPICSKDDADEGQIADHVSDGVASDTDVGPPPPAAPPVVGSFQSISAPTVGGGTVDAGMSVAGSVKSYSTNSVAARHTSGSMAYADSATAASASNTFFEPPSVHPTSIVEPMTVVRDPDEEDREEFKRRSDEDQYRLKVIWRVQQVTTLDGREVTIEEQQDARTLEGGDDRASRVNIQSTYFAQSTSNVATGSGASGAMNLRAAMHR